MIFEAARGQMKQSHLVQIVVPHGLLDKLDKQAKEEMVTRSALVRRIAVEYLKKVEGTWDATKSAAQINAGT